MNDFYPVREYKRIVLKLGHNYSNGSSCDVYRAIEIRASNTKKSTPRHDKKMVLLFLCLLVEFQSLHQSWTFLGSSF